MITIISGTNRVGSNTRKVAETYARILEQKQVPYQFLSLEGVNVLQRDEAFMAIENEYIVPTTDFLIVSPEYNGSFPGVLKLLMDTGKTDKLWWNKRAMLAGVATGRAGNLRGMDHLTGVLNHMKMTVLPTKLPISQVDKLLDAEGKYIAEPGTLQAMERQVDEYLVWIGAEQVP
jgi:chromate reductase